MPFTVYILYSKAIDQYYVGQTEDLADRLHRHCSGYSQSTKKATDWVLYHQEEYATRAEAMQRERYIKSRKSRKYIEGLARSVG